MATDTNKESASPDNIDTSKMKVGGEGKLGPRRLTPPRSIIKTVLPGLIVLVVIAAGILIYGRSQHWGDKVYAQAAGHKIYKKEIKDLIGSNKGISDHDAAEILADKYFYEAVANEHGVKITNKDIQNAYGNSIQQQKEQNKYAYQSRVNDLYYQKLQENNQGIYKGYLLVAHFSRNIALQPQTDSSNAFPTNSGNASAIAADKKYAQNFITNLYNQIEEHKITWDQAAAMEKADSQIGLNMYPSQTHSGPFDTSQTTNSLLVPSSAALQIQKLKSGQTSKPFAVTVTTTVGGSNEHFESYFLVVRMDSSSGERSNVPFVQELTQARKKLGYKVYV